MEATGEEECFIIQSLHKTWYDAKLLLDKDTLGDMERSNFEYERDFAKKLIDRLTRP